ncbi:MAG: GIY-YIG nuclease family protein [Candidatus Thorarchaeota archaeon]
MKGVYALIINASKYVVVNTRPLGDTEFVPGTWVYVGSALGTGSTRLDHRIKRHFSSAKTLHWHIDFLLDATGPPTDVIWVRTERAMECEIAEALKQHADFEIGPLGFGSSDCAARCGSHVFRFSGDGKIESVLSSLLLDMGLKPQSGLAQA